MRWKSVEEETPPAAEDSKWILICDGEIGSPCIIGAYLREEDIFMDMITQSIVTGVTHWMLPFNYADLNGKDKKDNPIIELYKSNKNKKTHKRRTS